MNAHALAQGAYAATSNTIKTPRAAEYEVIAQVTHDLKKAANREEGDFSTLAAALHRNNRLWSALASNVADENNDLPPPLRARIFYLAEFCKRHSAQVFAGKANIDPLLDINTAVLRGLRNEGQTV